MNKYLVGLLAGVVVTQFVILDIQTNQLKDRTDSMLALQVAELEKTRASEILETMDHEIGITIPKRFRG